MFRSLARLLSRPPVQAGLVVGGLAAIRAYQPSLVGRSRADQTLIVAGSIISGYAACNTFERALGQVCSTNGVDRTLAAGAIGTAAVIAANSELPAPARTAAALAATAAVTSAGLTLTRRAGAHRVLPGMMVGMAVAAASAAALRHQLRSYPDDGLPTPSVFDIGVSLAGGAALATTGWSLLAAERSAANGFATAAASRLGGRRGPWQAAAHLAIAGAAATVVRLAGRRILESFDTASDVVEPGYSRPPTSILTSGGPGSAIDFADIGVSGRRFVLEATTSSSINQVMGIDSAVDPIRVYVGIDSGPGIEARVDLAVAELLRTGAFERSLLIVASPSGSGYVNYIAIEAAEYLVAGDVATVTIQYGKRPSLLSIDSLDLAQRQHLALVDRIATELARRESNGRPRTVLYGESLGAQASQDAFSHPGAAALTERFIDKALWVGTPNTTRFQRSVLSASPADRRFGRFATVADLDPTTDYVFLDHHEDPVTRFNPSILYRRPSWLGPPGERPPNVSRTQRWVPAVTFWQTAFDTKNAANVVPGEFKAFGHDYRADLAEFVRAAYAIPGVTDDQMANAERALRRSEVERAARIERS